MPKVCVFFFFFFQAEDGIRDLTVTGVQTCALPIFQMVDGEVAGLITRLEAAKLEAEHQGARRTPLDVPFAHEITESSRCRHIRILRIVDAAAAAEHPPRARAHVQLAPPAVRAHRSAADSGILSDRATAQTRNRLADERFAEDLGGSELESRVERDRA